MANPIMCTLTEAELIERRKTVLTFLRRNAVSIKRLPDGYEYEFPASPEVLSQVRKAVDLEQKCCQFLSFTILEEGNYIHLTVTGPAEAQSLLTELFELA